MLVIRLQRVGRRNDPHFRVVVMDKRNAANSGKAIEILGSLSPRQKTSTVKEERVKYWLSVGAKPSDTVHNLLVSKSILSGPKIDVSAKPKKKKGEAMEAAADAENPTEKKAGDTPEEKTGESAANAPEKPSEVPAEVEEKKETE